MRAIVAAMALAIGAVLTIPAEGPGQVNTGTQARIVEPPQGFTTKASNGYTIDVGAETTPSRVILLAEKPGTGVQYTAPGTVTLSDGTKRIRARFGDFGRVDVRFRPSGHLVEVNPPCIKKTFLAEGGAYTGTIRFTGEQGFTRVRARRAKATPFPIPGTFCRQLISPGRGALLGTSHREDGSIIRFQAAKDHRAAASYFAAIVKEKRGKVRIERHVARFGPSASFTYDPLLTTASAQPPAPFRGSVSYAGNENGVGTVTGSIVVDLPAQPDVSVASNGRAWLVSATFCGAGEVCRGG